MCCGCWKEDGAHVIDNERVRGVQSLILEVYDHHGAGGNLHIVLDDNNVEDGDLAFCAAQIADGGYRGEDPGDQLSAERACLEALQAMTVEERSSALGLWDGCWSLWTR